MGASRAILGQSDFFTFTNPRGPLVSCSDAERA
jgi:hypothetical protein